MFSWGKGGDTCTAMYSFANNELGVIFKAVVTKYNKDCYVHALTPKFMWVGIILKIRYILFIHLLLLTKFKNFSS